MTPARRDASRRSGRRGRTTRATRGSLLVLLVLPVLLAATGCGGGGSDGGSGTGGPAAPTPPYDVVELFTGSGAGGQVSTTAVPLPDQDAADRFTRQFSDSDLAAQIGGAVDVAMVPQGSRLYGAVVAVGCTEPTRVAVTGSDGTYRVRAAGGAPSSSGCAHTTTTVALLTIGP